MKSAFVFLLIAFSFTAGAQLTTNVVWTEKSDLPKDDVIYYTTDKSLVWHDFAGKPPSDNGPVAALTVSGFGYNAGIQSTNGKGTLNITVYCYFNKNKSWVKPGKNTAYILTHEQHHFDVSYLAAAIFVDKLQSAQFSFANYKELLPRIYQECAAIMNKMQNEYDGQTRNGQEKDEQYRWNDMIDARVSSLTK